MLERFQRSLLARLWFLMTLGGCVLIGAIGIYLHASLKRAVDTQVHREMQNAALVLLHRLDEDGAALDKELIEIGDHFLIRVSGPDGKTLIETKGMEAWLPSRAMPAKQDGWRWGEVSSATKGLHRLLTLPWGRGWIQIARDVTTEAWILEKFRKSIYLMLLLVPLGVGALGYPLTKMILGPVTHLVERTESISADHLKLRIEEGKLPTELRPLSRALNATIQRLEKAFTQLNNLNSDLAHELRTPIHALRLEVEAMLSREDLPPDVTEAMAGMMDTLEHLTAMIEQMLFLARAEDPALRIQRVDVDVDALLAHSAAPFVALADERGIRIEIGPAGGLILQGDPILLRRALHNLLANAIRHAPENSMVLLEAHGGGNEDALIVRDRGTGVPVDVLAQLGHRFVRSDSSRSRSSGGTGLGLAIVQEIARLHGGALSIQSPDQRGTVAKITLPRT